MRSCQVKKPRRFSTYSLNPSRSVDTRRVRSPDLDDLRSRTLLWGSRDCIGSCPCDTPDRDEIPIASDSDGGILVGGVWWLSCLSPADHHRHHIDNDRFARNHDNDRPSCVDRDLWRPGWRSDEPTGGNGGCTAGARHLSPPVAPTDTPVQRCFLCGQDGAVRRQLRRATRNRRMVVGRRPGPIQINRQPTCARGIHGANTRQTGLVDRSTSRFRGSADRELDEETGKWVTCTRQYLA